MLRRVLTVSLLGLALAGGPALGQPLKPETERAIDEAMREAVSTGWTAGGVVAAMRQGEVVFARGYGLANLETGTPIASDSVFRIGSITKQFTAAAVLLLAEDGKLSLDDPVSRRLAQFPAEDPTTIRQLLTHTSGIVDYVGGEGFDREQWLPHTTDQLVAFVLARTPLHGFEPGADWRYSSSNYALAGAIVEEVSGQPLAAFLKARIFDPLGMNATAMDDARDVVPHRASGYDRLKAEAPGYANAREVSMSVPFAAGAMRSSAVDLLVWGHALTHGRVLKAESYRQMITPVRLKDGSLPVRTRADGTRRSISYGLGVWIDGPADRPNLSHDGAIDGFTGTLSIFTGPDVVVAGLVNTSPSQHLPFGKVIEAVKAEVLAAKK
ncbi:serine hydrolase domain-containing protein [Phenylobacterium sp.]|uniref:serine hydrolase domain-containing protein n=1 Tax=Phenylobacterium sp. TaxID=1871053 RepID=UPI002896FD70|nr:serine hydrolase domain-containing protein [Phenylobacterium sp.]